MCKGPETGWCIGLLRTQGPSLFEARRKRQVRELTKAR